MSSTRRRLKDGPPQKPSGRLLTVLGLALYLPVAAGFFLHTSPATGATLVFGKYSVAYALFLLFLLLPPAAIRLLASALSRPTMVEDADHGRVVIGGWRKVRLGCLAVIGGLLVAVLAIELLIALPRHLTFKRKRMPSDWQPFFEWWPGGMRPETNRWGWLGPEVRPTKPPGTFRIFALGGSTTFLYHNVPHDLNFTARLNRSLAEARPAWNIEVVNAACSGHSSFQSLMKYALIVRELDPDVILVMHGVNDAEEWKTALAPDAWRRPYERDYAHEARWALGVLMEEGALGRPGQSLWMSSHTGGAIAGGMKQVFYSDLRRGPAMSDDDRLRVIEAELSKGLPPLRRNLRSLGRLARSHGCRVFLLSQPTMYREQTTKYAVFNYHTPEEADWHVWAGRTDLFRTAWIRTMRRYNDACRETARDLGADVVDLETAVPAKWRNFHPKSERLDGVHLSHNGCALAAEALHKAILPLIPEAPPGHSGPRQSSRP